jgi:PTH1 family peptidyl-tRNA hydrolase
MPVEFIVAGLGNPGDPYRRTRHNLGFLAVEALATVRRSRWQAPARRRRTARCNVAGRDVLLVEPLTFMNLSGDALAALVLEETIPPERLLVVCDDIALPLGQVRLRRAGSDGGHNGLASIIERLGTTAFPRLRMGIGPVPPRVDAAEFVLAEFLPEEDPAVEAMVAEAMACAEAWIVDGVERAMARFNARRDPSPPAEPPA